MTSKDHIKLFMNKGMNGRLDVTMDPIILDKQQLLTLECNIREDVLIWFKQKSGFNQLTKKDTKMTWAAKICRPGPMEKRKKIVLDNLYKCTLELSLIKEMTSRIHNVTHV